MNGGSPVQSGVPKEESGMANKIRQLLSSAQNAFRKRTYSGSSGKGSEGSASVSPAGSTGSTERDMWGGKMDFILSCIGYSVGLGTIWRFPYICYRNGGGAFLVPYLIYMFLLGMPLVMLELGYGQFSSLSPIAVWRMSPLFQVLASSPGSVGRGFNAAPGSIGETCRPAHLTHGLGYGMVFISAIVCIYYNVIIAWTLYYFVLSFSWDLPWASCDNEWNTPACFRRMGVNGTSDLENTTSILISNNNGSNVTLQPKTPSEEFWEYKLLGVTAESSIDNIGEPRWQLVLSLLIAWIIVFLCLCKGVKSSGKVVYVTVTLPYVLLFVFLVRGVTLDGAIVGIKYYIIPNFKHLLTFQPWAEAAQQLFYSMGAAWGALVTMSSYNKFNNNFYRDSFIIAFADTFTALLVGFVIFSTLGYMSHETGATVAKVVTDGPGLVFVVLPEAIANMPGAAIWAIIFFIFIFTVGVDSQFGLFETVLSALFDQFPSLRRRKILVTGVLSILEFLLGIPLVCRGGIYVFQVLDWYCATFSLMVLAFGECIVISWVYGVERFYKDMTMMLGRRPHIWWKICWMVITPLIIVFVLTIDISQHHPVRYGSYEYPHWAILMGWVFALISIIPIPAVAIIKIVSSKHRGSLKERVWGLMKPEADWGPAEAERFEEYQRIQHIPSVTQKLLDPPQIPWGKKTVSRTIQLTVCQEEEEEERQRLAEESDPCTKV